MCVLVRLGLVLGREVHVREVGMTFLGMSVFVVMAVSEVLEDAGVLVKVVRHVIVQMGVEEGLVVVLVVLTTLVMVLMGGAAGLLAGGVAWVGHFAPCPAVVGAASLSTGGCRLVT